MKYIYSRNDVRAYNNRMGVYKTERHLGFIQKFLGPRSSTILDLGGGNGRLALPLAHLGYKVTVVDVSAEALGLLSTESQVQIDCVESDIMAFETDRKFDVVLTVDCVKYLTHASLEEVFLKVRGLLADDGVWIFSDMNTRSWRYYLRGLMGRGHPRYNIDTTAAYLSICERAGFKVSEMSGYCWMPLFWNSNSRLVRVFKGIEELFGLGKWTAQSPWLLMASRKAPSVCAPRPKHQGVRNSEAPICAVPRAKN